MSKLFPLSPKFKRVAAATVLIVGSGSLAAYLYNKSEHKIGQSGQEIKTEEKRPSVREDFRKLCFQGCPAGAPAANKVVETSIYVLSNNGKTKFADWVVYEVSPQTIGKTKRRTWHTDHDLPQDETLSPKDYKGVEAALGMERGHQAPLADLTGADDWQEADDLSNITPQTKDLNRGAWKALEYAERKLAKRGNLTVHSATGPLYERPMPELPHAHLDHKIPSGYWKVVAIEQDREILVAAFVMDQALPRHADFCASAVTVRVVESRARLNFFPVLERSRQEEIETAPGKLLPQLGCESGVSKKRKRRP